MNKENLLIVISTPSKSSILNFPLLYGGVSIPRDYWKRVHIMFWGESIKTFIQDSEIQKKVLEVQENGVEFSSCIVCAQEYEAVDILEKHNIICNHTGELLTEALKNDQKWALLTI